MNRDDQDAAHASGADALNKHNHLRTGRSAVFASECSDYRAQNGMRVVIVRPLDASEADEAEVGRMYRVSRPDGSQFDAFEDELTPFPLPFSPSGAIK